MSKIHENSIKSYYQICAELGAKQLELYDYYLKYRSRKFTDRQIKYGLGKSDMNMVRPRINELIELGLVEWCGNTKCPDTGRQVRETRLVSEDNSNQMELF